MNLEPVALAAEALAKACREIRPNKMAVHGVPRAEIQRLLDEAKDEHTFTIEIECADSPSANEIRFEKATRTPPKIPSFVADPPPADLHPMCDAELDRLMTQLADRAAEYGQGSVAETMKAIRAFVRRKFDEETGKIAAFAAKDNIRMRDEAMKPLLAEIEKRVVGVREILAERDQLAESLKIARKNLESAREVVVDAIDRCDADDQAELREQWRQRAGLPSGVWVRPGEGIEVKVYGAGGGGSTRFSGGSEPLTGHATGCTPDRCVPTCPSPRGKR